MGKRPVGQRWAGLWEVPHDTPDEGVTEVKALGIISRKYASLVSKKFREIGKVIHPVTRFKITVRVFMGEVSGKGASNYYEELAWVCLSDMEKYPKSSPQSKMIAMAVKALELKKEV